MVMVGWVLLGTFGYIDLPPGGDLLHPGDGVEDVDDEIEQGDLHERHRGRHPAHASNFSLTQPPSHPSCKTLTPSQEKVFLAYWVVLFLMLAGNRLKFQLVWGA